MDLIKITNQQLYELIQNERLDKEIREKAGKEFLRRKLDNTEMSKISSDYQDKYRHVNDPLELKYRILVIALPFIPLYFFDPFSMQFRGIFAAQFLPNGYKRKWKQFLRFSIVGYLTWTILVILLSKYIH